MEKIIFFDIDGTLFDPMLFLKNYFSTLEKFKIGEERLKSFYEETRNEMGYFVPSRFLEKLSLEIPQISKVELTKNFWDASLFEKSMYKDVATVQDLAKKITVGIFSKGERVFQEEKIVFIKDLLNEKNIYIFPNKMDKIDEVLGKYPNHKIYIVDDRLDVLTKAKSISSSIVAILIDRSNNYEDTGDIIRIGNLNKIKDLI